MNTKECKNITPSDSVVPVYLEEKTEEELAEAEAATAAFEAEQKTRRDLRAKALKKLEKLGLTAEELQAIIK